MTLDADFIAGVAGDYQIFDGLETITYWVRATDETIETVQGLCVALKGGETDAGGMRSQRTEQYWSVAAATLPNVTPVPGDKITGPDGVVWVVTRYELDTLGVTNIQFRIYVTKVR